MELEFVRLNTEGIDAFRNVILDHVYAQLTEMDDFDEESVIVLGALADDVPVGAVAAQLYLGDEVYIHSIVVEEAYRRKGVGAEIVRTLLSLALTEFAPDIADDPHSFDCNLYIEYALPEADRPGFEAFLRAVGFYGYSEYPGLYFFSAEQAASLGKESPDVFLAKDAEGADADSLAAFFEESGLYPDPDLCFFTGTEDEPSCLMMTDSIGNGDYRVISVNMEEEQSKAEEIEKLFLATIAGLRKKTDTFRLMVNGQQNAENDFWEAFAEAHGEKLHHRKAVLTAVFESEDAQ